MLDALVLFFIGSDSRDADGIRPTSPAARVSNIHFSQNGGLHLFEMLLK